MTFSFHRHLLLALALVGTATAAHASPLSFLDRIDMRAAPVAMAQPFSAAAANDGVQAQSLVERLGKEALATIADEKMGADARKQVFRRLLTQNFDMGTIGRFAMGRFWRVATPAQQQEYTRLYEKMIIEVYTSRFSNYSGQTFKVVGNRLDASGDVVVNSTVTSASSAPVLVDWRIRPKGGSYRIIDVMVEGVSMAQTQRNDFAGVIQQGGGEIDALLAYLRNGGVSDVKK